MCTSHYSPNWLSTLYYHTAHSAIGHKGRAVRYWAGRRETFLRGVGQQSFVFTRPVSQIIFLSNIRSRHTFFFKFDETFFFSSRQLFFLLSGQQSYFFPNPTISKLFSFHFGSQQTIFFSKKNSRPPPKKKKAKGKSLNRSWLNSLEQACMYYIIAHTFMIKIHPSLAHFISNTQWRF